MNGELYKWQRVDTFVTPGNLHGNQMEPRVAEPDQTASFSSPLAQDVLKAVRGDLQSMVALVRVDLEESFKKVMGQVKRCMLSQNQHTAQILEGIRDMTMTSHHPDGIPIVGGAANSELLEEVLEELQAVRNGVDQLQNTCTSPPCLQGSKREQFEGVREMSQELQKIRGDIEYRTVREKRIEASIAHILEEVHGSRATIEESLTRHVEVIRADISKASSQETLGDLWGMLDTVQGNVTELLRGASCVKAETPQESLLVSGSRETAKSGRGLGSKEKLGRSLSESARASLQALFKEIDTNNSGSISRLEAVKALRSNEGLARILGFEGMIRVRQADGTLEAFCRAFENVDVNGDNQITCEELLAFAEVLRGDGQDNCAGPEQALQGQHAVQALHDESYEARFARELEDIRRSLARQ